MRTPISCGRPMTACAVTRAPDRHEVDRDEADRHRDDGCTYEILALIFEVGTVAKPRLHGIDSLLREA
jgi:hypothetical protein